MLTPYPSPPLDSDSERDGSRHVGRDLRLAGSSKETEQGQKRTVNELLDLYFLADGFGRESLKSEVLERLEKGYWTGRVEKEGLKRCFEELEIVDGLRRWIVRGLVLVWTGGEGLGYDRGDKEDWSWVSEEMREDVLRALMKGEGKWN